MGLSHNNKYVLEKERERERVSPRFERNQATTPLEITRQSIYKPQLQGFGRNHSEMVVQRETSLTSPGFLINTATKSIIMPAARKLEKNTNSFFFFFFF